MTLIDSYNFPIVLLTASVVDRLLLLYYDDEELTLETSINLKSPNYTVSAAFSWQRQTRNIFSNDQRFVPKTPQVRDSYRMVTHVKLETLTFYVVILNTKRPTIGAPGLLLESAYQRVQ